MATIIQAGTSAAVLIDAGNVLNVSGTGVAVLGPGPQQNTQISINGTANIGPFNSSRSVYISATSQIVYEALGETPGAVPSRLLTADYVLTADDDGKRFQATTAITLTIPAGLSPRPELTVLPPPTGNLTLAFSGGATGNGAATSITRTRAANPAGIVITPYPDVTDGYGVSGA